MAQRRNESRPRWRAAVVFLLFLPSMGLAVPASAAEPTTVTVCDLIKSPERFSGKMVTFRAELMSARRLEVADAGCGPVIIVFPGEYEVRPPAHFHLVEDANLKRLQDARSELVVPPTMKPGKVFGVFEGRFDSVYTMQNGKKVERDPVKMRLGRDDFRVVLLQVKTVEVQSATKLPEH